MVAFKLVSLFLLPFRCLLDNFDVNHGYITRKYKYNCCSAGGVVTFWLGLFFSWRGTDSTHGVASLNTCAIAE